MGSGLFSRIFKKESTTEEEIRQLVDEDEERGDLEVSQREMINNIFEFDDLHAGDIMTHRTDMEAVEDSASIADVAALSIKAGYSRIPVYHEDLDNICGIIYVKDLLKFVGAKILADEKLSDFIREPMFVPETIPCGKLFARMTETRVQLAVVVDEYGGTAGLVTMEDILESIVGNIMDEYDEEEEEVTQIDEKTFTFDGSADIEEAQKVLQTELPQGDYDTLAGFVINLLGFLPAGNEAQPVVAHYENLTFTVLQMDERRIERIKVEINT